MLLNIKSKLLYFTFYKTNFNFSLNYRESETDIGLRFLIPMEHKQKSLGPICQIRDNRHLNKSKAKGNENQHMLPLVNIIKRMDSVLNSFKINE